MSGTQHIRLFIEERLTAAAEEIFGVLQKTISEYEEQVVQSKREVDQLKQDMIRHLNTVKPHIHIDSQPVSEELLPLQQLNPRQELMSSQEEETVQHQSQRVKEEQRNSGTNGFVTTESTSDSKLVPPPYTNKTVQQCPQVKEEHSGPSFIPDSQTSIYNIVTNGFVTSESTSDSQLIPPYNNETVQHSTQVKEEQVDLGIIPDSETSIYNIATNGFVPSESTSDSQLIPCYATDTATTSHNVAIRCNESDGSDLTFGQKNVDMYCMEQKICRFCRTQFRSYSDLKKHVEESHIGQRAFKCPECHKEFARKDRFSIHYRIHTGEKRHSCPVCGKLFIQRSNCIIHMRTHTGVKPHSCPVCRKLFAQSSSLNLHMRIHTGLKPYSCTVCGKVFNQNSNLKAHMRIHTGRGAGKGEEVGEQH